MVVNDDITEVTSLHVQCLIILKSIEPFILLMHYCKHHSNLIIITDTYSLHLQWEILKRNILRLLSLELLIS